MTSGIKSVQYISVNSHAPQVIEGMVVQESLACISVNGQELATFMCSPHDLESLALGFLYNEDIIRRLDDVRQIRPSKSRTCVDVWLQDVNKELPKRAIVTAGCGGGVTFYDLSGQHEPLQSELTVTTGQVAALMQQMLKNAALYQEARGVHTAVLAQDDQILLQVEDVGRHNCLDRLVGVALQNGVDTSDKILFSSGRISSEMMNKARRMGTAVVCSRTSPTSLSVALAQAWNITIIAYLRQNRMRIYSHTKRIKGINLETAEVNQ